MTVRLVDNTVIALEGVSAIEDAEPLLQLLLDNPTAAIDWRQCDRAHAAIIQILMMSNATRIGPPRGTFLQEVVESAIVRWRQRAFPTLTDVREQG